MKFETGNLQIPTSTKCSSCDTPQIVDLSKHLLFQLPDEAAPLRMFAREHGMYLFGAFITLGQLSDLTKRLQAGELTADDLMHKFYECATKEALTHQLSLASQELPCFSIRAAIIQDTIDAHFEGKYSLSVPAGFILVEGILREIGGIALKDDLTISIPIDRWENRLMPELQARATSFRSFINALFKGSQDAGTFNRNPVLHGVDVQYNRKPWSMMLLMTLFEIRLFLFFRAQPEVIK